jgi:hypothetical protein
MTCWEEVKSITSFEPSTCASVGHARFSGPLQPNPKLRRHAFCHRLSSTAKASSNTGNLSQRRAAEPIAHDLPHLNLEEQIMSIAELSTQTVSTIYEEVADTVVAYMVDCGLKDTDVNTGEFQFAFNHAYKPLPRFWRDFELQPVIEAVSRQYPTWHSAVVRRDQSAKNVLRKVKKLLNRKAFDEANAEMLMALPQLARPTTADVALECICTELWNRGLNAKLRFAQWIGLDCGDEALELVRCLEQTTSGVEYVSPPTQFARQWRDQCVAKRHAVTA